MANSSRPTGEYLTCSPKKVFFQFLTPANLILHFPVTLTDPKAAQKDQVVTHYYREGKAARPSDFSPAKWLLFYLNDLYFLEYALVFQTRAALVFRREHNTNQQYQNTLAGVRKVLAQFFPGCSLMSHQG